MSDRDLTLQHDTMKVAFIGPKESGKTLLANHFCHEERSKQYDPTVGVRIVRTSRELHVVESDGSEQTKSVKVEIWDCSGDQSYEGCWPAIMHQLDAICVVFSPTSKAQANEVKVWCDWFAKRAKLEEGQVAIFAHGKLTAKHRPFNIKLGGLYYVVLVVVVVEGIYLLCVGGGR